MAERMGINGQSLSINHTDLLEYALLERWQFSEQKKKKTKHTQLSLVSLSYLETHWRAWLNDPAHTVFYERGHILFALPFCKTTKGIFLPAVVGTPFMDIVFFKYCFFKFCIKRTNRRPIKMCLVLLCGCLISQIPCEQMDEQSTFLKKINKKKKKRKPRKHCNNKMLLQ